MAVPTMVDVRVYLPKELVRRVDHVAVDGDWSRSEAIAALLTDGLRYREAKS